MNARLQDLTAMALIGDGMVGLISPREHVRSWRFGPKRLRRLYNRLAKRPVLTRVLSGVGVGIGVWMALRQSR